MLNNKLVFYIPFYYTFSVNRRGLEGIAYFFEFYFFSFLAYFMYLGSFSLADYCELLIMLTGVTSLYEIGYIDNNTRSIKNEINPTLRHSEEQIYFARNNYFSIYLSRIIIALLGFYFLWGSKQYLLYSILISTVTLFVFILYNNIRKGWSNRILFSLLRFFRYLSVIIFFKLESIIISFIISIINFINNLSWYPKRTNFSLPRFFGTKLFDAFIYFFIGMLYIFYVNQKGYLFIYLSAIKIMLFLYKIIRARSGIYEK